MEHGLPALPFAQDALAPTISAETLDYHHGKHHRAYVTNLNKLIGGTEFEAMALEDIVRAAPPGGLFNNAAQAWNHGFYWNSLTPASGEPSAALSAAIAAKWGDRDGLKAALVAAAAGNFGSGWTWLVKTADAGLDIVNTANAGTPLAHETGGEMTPVLTIDVWEHAYYVDYRNRRPDYLAAVWELMNWKFASANFGA